MKKNYIQNLVIISVFCFSCVAATQNPIEPVSWSQEDVAILKAHLFKNYDTNLRPGSSYGTTVCSLGLTISHIQVNEARLSMTVYGHLDMRWNDPKLMWNPSNYGGVKYLKLYYHQIWKPDIYLYNSMEPAASLRWYMMSVTLHPSGDIHSRNPANFTVVCDLNLSNWPYDVQTCHLSFIAWTATAKEIDLEIIDKNSNVQLNLLNSNNQWKIEKATIKKHSNIYGEDNFPDIRFNIDISRVSSIYYYVIVSPPFAIMVLVLGSFCVSPRSSGKLIFNSLAAVCTVLFLLYFSRKLPLIGPNTPIIMLFYSKILYVIGLSIVEAVIVMILVRTKHSEPLPDFIRKYFIKKPGRLTQLNVTEENINDENNPEFEIGNNDSYPFKGNVDVSKTSILDEEEEYILLASLIDKFSFTLTIAVFIILSLTHSLHHL